MTAVTLLSQKKQKKNLVVDISWKRGWWIKVWEFGSDVFFLRYQF